jgi:hypothetical protein
VENRSSYAKLFNFLKSTKMYKKPCDSIPQKVSRHSHGNDKVLDGKVYNLKMRILNSQLFICETKHMGVNHFLCAITLFYFQKLDSNTAQKARNCRPPFSKICLAFVKKGVCNCVQYGYRYSLLC